MTRALLALLLLFGHLPLSAAPRGRAVKYPPPPPQAVVSAARAAAEAALSTGVPAVQIAMSQGGVVRYAEAFGMDDKENASVATPRSVLQTGSLTKQFTAAAILRLAERGSLSLDDRIEKFVPEFNPRGAKVTLRQLLSHTSGVPQISPNQYAPLSRAQCMSLVNNQPFEFTPGSKFSYNNTGYRLLGYAIESISGMPYADFIHTEFALPLGLAETGLCGTSGLPRPDGYGIVQGKWVRIPSVETSVAYSAGSLCSSTSDLVRWSHLLATGGVILPESYVAMTTRVRLNNNALTNYGLGQFLQNVLGLPAVWHTGAINGFQSSLLYFPEHEIAVAVIVNALPFPAAGDAHQIALKVAKAALGIP